MRHLAYSLLGALIASTALVIYVQVSENWIAYYGAPMCVFVGFLAGVLFAGRKSERR